MTKIINDLQTINQFKEGYCFYFEVDGATITANASTWSGKESVCVDGVLVSERRNLFSRTGEHEFEINGKKYCLEFKLTNLFNGELVCSVFCDSILVASQNKAFHQTRNSLAILSEGYWFYFDVDGATIVANASAWSGKESVFVDDELVSEQRNLFSRTGEHEFEINGKKYRIQLNLSNMLTGELICSLFCDSKLVATQDKAFHQTSESLGKQLFLIMFYGFIAGASIVYLIERFG